MTPTFKNLDFVAWAQHREEARLHKLDSSRFKKPTDPYILTFSFCNVCREDDRTTIWIKENIRDPFHAAAPEVHLQAMVLARLFNSTATLLEFLDRGGLTIEGGINRKRCLEIAGERKGRDLPVFSMAYRVAPGPMDHAGGKIGYVLDAALQVKKVPTAKTRQGWSKELFQYGGIGNFIAGQIIADAAETDLLRDAPDTLTWAPLGPGAMAGMNHALGRPMKNKIDELEYIRVGREQFDLVAEAIPGETAMMLTLHDVASNVNCETSKWVRMKSGVGAFRRYHTSYR